MTIYNPSKYERSWDWGFLDKCFGHTRIRIGDVDGPRYPDDPGPGIVERNGMFLYLETKEPGVIVPTRSGQCRLWLKLAGTGLFTVMIFWGHPNKPEFMTIWRPNELYPQGQDALADRLIVQQTATEDDICTAVSAWFLKANGNHNQVQAENREDLLRRARAAIAAGRQFEFITGQWG